MPDVADPASVEPGREGRLSTRSGKTLCVPDDVQLLVPAVSMGDFALDAWGWVLDIDLMRRSSRHPDLSSPRTATTGERWCASSTLLLWPG